MVTKIFIPLVVLVLLLTGCNGGGSSDGNHDAYAYIGGTTTTPEVIDNAITITGATAVTGLAYHYQIPWPDMNGAVTYKSVELPRWASVDAKGAIVGTPTQASAWQPIKVVASSDDKRITAKGHLVVQYAGHFVRSQKIDFYNHPFDGHPRHYRKDLDGGQLQGTVFFMQTHSVAPQRDDNYDVDKKDQTKSHYMPDIIALRGALLLFVPAKGITPITLDVQVSAPGKAIKTLSMAPPSQLPAPDTNTQMTFSTRAWSVRLPWDSIRNGLSLTFIADADAPDTINGELPAYDIDIDRATQLEFQNVLLGMLTYPPTDEPYYTYDAPIKAATDYFQEVPVSKLIMGNYAPMQLDRAIVNRTYDIDGNADTKADRYTAAKVYDGNSPDPADRTSDSTGASIYSGDMRENVNKSQVSVGIDLANMGITSWDLTQRYPKTIKIITNTHAYGEYKCINDPSAEGYNKNCPASGHWRVEHGLSGGNGIGTITATIGNEASHEWGHAYGLGHWPGAGLTDDCRWSDHNFMTGWGYIAFRNRMRNSIGFIANGGEKIEYCTYLSGTHTMPTRTAKKGEWVFSRDAMSGGNYQHYTLSNYSFYTSYSARLIQQNLDGFDIADTDNTSGYKQWSRQAGAWQVTDPTLDGSPAPVVQEVGVPVATLLGGYDPAYQYYQKGYPTADKKRAVIYPVFHGNYGNIFNLPEPSMDKSVDACWMDVSNNAEGHKLVAIKASRNDPDSINQFHFNLRASFKPTHAALKCRHDGITTTLDERSFDIAIPDLPPVAIVGQDHGFKQLKKREMQAISKGVMQLPANNLMNVSHDLQIKINSYTKAELTAGITSATALDRVLAIKQLEKSVKGIKQVVAYSKALRLDKQTIAQRLIAYLQTQGLLKGNSFGVSGSPMLDHYGHGYLEASAETHGKLAGKLPVAQNLEGKEQHRWVMDIQGRLHPANKLALCLTTNGATRGTVFLAECAARSAKQRWIYNAQNHSLRSVANTSACLDDHSTLHYAETWNCHGGQNVTGNQGWSGFVQSDEPWLGLLDANTIKQIRGILQF